MRRVSAAQGTHGNVRRAIFGQGPPRSDRRQMGTQWCRGGAKATGSAQERRLAALLAFPSGSGTQACTRVPLPQQRHSYRRLSLTPGGLHPSSTSSKAQATRRSPRGAVAPAGSSRSASPSIPQRPPASRTTSRHSSPTWTPPAEHHKRIRHSNLLERTLRETRRRVNVITRLPGEQSCLSRLGRPRPGIQGLARPHDDARRAPPAPRSAPSAPRAGTSAACPDR